MKRKILSVVTVCYNPGVALERTAHSVAMQTARDEIEYIVVDGGSTDGTADVLKKMLAEGVADKVVSEKDRGIYDAMNKGAMLAEGSWIIFMNAADTFSSPEVARLLIGFANKNPNAGVIYGDVRKQNHEGDWNVAVASEPCNAHRMYFCHQSAMTRLELQRRVGFDINHTMSADFKFFKTLYRQGVEFAHFPMPVADFDTSGVSASRRSKGLADNMRVIWECDSWGDRIKFLSRLLPVYTISRLRGK